MFMEDFYQNLYLQRVLFILIIDSMRASILQKERPHTTEEKSVIEMVTKQSELCSYIPRQPFSPSRKITSFNPLREYKISRIGKISAKPTPRTTCDFTLSETLEPTLIANVF